MTSKEALEEIKNLIIDTYGYEYEKVFDIIEKDLEVLEELKEHFQYTETGQWYIDLQESDFDFRNECSKEEWNKSPQKKIKEWLRND